MGLIDPPSFLLLVNSSSDVSALEGDVMPFSTDLCHMSPWSLSK